MDVPGLAANGHVAFVGGSCRGSCRAPLRPPARGLRPAPLGQEAASCDSALPAAAAGIAAAATACAASRRRHASQSTAPSLVAAAVAGEKKKKKVSVRKVAEKLFIQAKKSDFAPNAWYESPDIVTSRKDNVWDYWQLRPTRTIDKICDGRERAGCTWTQLDGRRGASFVRIDQDGKVSYIREVVEPPGWSKFKENNMQSLQPVFGVMETIKNVFNTFDNYLVVEEKDREAPKPRFGLAQPKSRRAMDVVQYLWEEAQYDPDDVNAVERILAEYSDDAVIEDMTYVDEVWAKGKDAVQKYQEETKANAPKGLRWVLDELSEGDKACVALWHIEFAGKRSPRGVSYYELDEQGKVCYVRVSYDLGF